MKKRAENVSRFYHSHTTSAGDSSTPDLKASWKALNKKSKLIYTRSTAIQWVKRSQKCQKKCGNMTTQRLHSIITLLHLQNLQRSYGRPEKSLLLGQTEYPTRYTKGVPSENSKKTWWEELGMCQRKPVGQYGDGCDSYVKTVTCTSCSMIIKEE